MPERPFDSFACPKTGAPVRVVVDPNAEPCGDLTEAVAALLISIDQRRREKQEEETAT